MDVVDRQILHCLQHRGRASFRRIGDVVGVSEQTVARRYRALVDAGAVRVVLLPQSRADGEQTWFVRITCRPDAVDALAEAVAVREDVSWVSVNAGGGEVVCVTSSSPSTAHLSVLDRLPRTRQVIGFTAHAVMHMHVGGQAEWLAFDDPLTPDQLAGLLHDTPPPPPALASARPIRDGDAPLFAVLARDGRAGVATLARATGWSQARVSARLEELLTDGSAYVQVDLAPRLLGFHSTAYLWLTVPPGELEATGRALSLHPETSFAAAVSGPANLMTAVTCRDADHLYTYVTRRVGALPAVRQAEVVPVLRRLKQAGTRVRDGRLELPPATAGPAGAPSRRPPR
jgi:DNA-binding Lrp family transcriptional regulator